MATRTSELPAVRIPASALLLATVISVVGWLLLAALVYGLTILSALAAGSTPSSNSRSAHAGQ
jgi:hypothetical protein